MLNHHQLKLKKQNQPQQAKLPALLDHLTLPLNSIMALNHTQMNTSVHLVKRAKISTQIITSQCSITSNNNDKS